MTRMTPSEAIVETMVAQGVTHVFGIVGSAYMDALDIFEPAGIRFVSVAHEQGAGHMADGFARACGRHGVCIAQNGPGVTNFVTATNHRLGDVRVALNILANHVKRRLRPVMAEMIHDGRRMFGPRPVIKCEGYHSQLCAYGQDRRTATAVRTVCRDHRRIRSCLVRRRHNRGWCHHRKRNQRKCEREP